MSGQFAVAVALILVAMVLAVVALAVRRTLITRRGGVVECALRRGADASWRHGLAEYEPAQLSWHWWLSLRLRPSATFDRADLRIVRTRPPTAAETARLGPDLIIAECRISRSGATAAGADGLHALELGLSEAALTGLLSWLESSPEYYLRTR